MKSLFLLAASLFALNAFGLDVSYLQKFQPPTLGSRSSVTDLSRMFINEMKDRGILSLIPQDFALESSMENSQLSKTVDEITLELLRTKAGPELCRKAVKERNIDLFTKFGLSVTAIQQNDDVCSSTPSSRLDVSPKDLPRYFERKPYIFAFTKSQNSIIDSWTSVWSVLRPTLIVVNPETITAETLIRAVAHEIYMSLDIKSSYPYQGDPIVSSPDACAVLSALHEPLIRYTLNTYRAFRFENQVAKELGFKFEDLPASPSQEDLNRISELLISLFTSNRFQAERRAVKKIYAPCFDATTIAEKWNILRNKTLNTGAGARKTLLQFMVEPQIQNLSVNEGFEPGPRPNIGNGTGAKNVKGTASALTTNTTSSPALTLRDRKEGNSRSQLQTLIKKMDDERPGAPSSLRKSDDSERPTSSDSSLRLRLDDQ
jgi:hypothetical protein